MKKIPVSFEQLLADETYFERITQWANPPTACIKQVHRLGISLIMACLQQQLRTDIGKALVPQILEKQLALTRNSPTSSLNNLTNFTALVKEGNRLLGMLIPGKKSEIMRIIGHYTKLSFKNIDPIIGLCAYTLFTRLAFDLASPDDKSTLLVPFNELKEFTPELNNKDYVAIGVYSILSLYRPVSIATATS